MAEGEKVGDLGYFPKDSSGLERAPSIEIKQKRIHETPPVFHNFRGKVCG